MLATKLSSCEWSKLQPAAWVNMRCSNFEEEYLDRQYTESDFDNFVEILFREFAERIKVRYCDVRDILYGHNIKFFEGKARYFSDYETIQPTEEEYKAITNLLLMPSVYELERKSSVQAFLDSYEDLELKDKVEILDRLASAKIELGPLNVGPANSVGSTIVALSERSKYQLVKSVFEAEVQINVELR